jgi:hypothetical protein
MLEHLETKISPLGLTAWMEADVDPWLRQRARDRFTNEGDDVSGPWTPLSPYTQMIRSQMGYGPDHPINVRTGELENYITSAGNVFETGVGVILETPGGTVQPDMAVKITTAQQGSSFPVTPPRPVLGVNERDLEAIMVTLANWIGRV